MKFKAIISVITTVVAVRAGSIDVSSAYCDQEGICSPSDSHNIYSVCASGYWQSLPAEGHSCVSGTVVPNVIDSVICSSTASFYTSSISSSSASFYTPSLPSSSTSFYTSSLSSSSQSPYISVESIQSRKPEAGTLENTISTITAIPSVSTSSAEPTKTESSTLAVSPSVDSKGIKSYLRGGKMASVYDADSTSTFRCSEIPYPENGLYVAFWTPFEVSLYASDQSQPAPDNCGRYINLTNPLTNTSCEALVLDRCASCVGVGNVWQESTTQNSTSNGATVDLSRNLWNLLYEDAPDNVYDIQYPGFPLQGTNSTPLQIAN